jgi:hypothetical protein
MAARLPLLLKTPFVLDDRRRFLRLAARPGGPPPCQRTQQQDRAKAEREQESDRKQANKELGAMMDRLAAGIKEQSRALTAATPHGQRAVFPSTPGSCLPPNSSASRKGRWIHCSRFK